MNGINIILQLMEDNISDPEQLKKMRTAFLSEELQYQMKVAKALDPYGGYSGNQIALIIFGGIFGGAALVLGACALAAYLIAR